MLHHITRDRLVITALAEMEPQGVFVLNGQTNELHTDFLQPIAQKIALVRSRNEQF